MKKYKSFERQLVRLAIFPPLSLLLLLLWTMIIAEISTPLILLTALLSAITISYCVLSINQKVFYQFRSVGNLLEAMVHGDYSLRAHAISRETTRSAFNELSLSINSLADRLRQQRLESTQSQLLLRMIINHIDVAIITLDNNNEIDLINPSAEKLLNTSSIQEVLEEQLEIIQKDGQNSNQVLELNLGEHQGKFKVHIEKFIEQGNQHKLIFITDVSTILRNEERAAWQSLVRVISHEINNSLTPIASISQTLIKTLANHEKTGASAPPINELKIILERSNGLKLFVNSFKRITQLPAPDKKRTSLLQLLSQSCALFSGRNIRYSTSKDYLLDVDPIQFKQVLINLVKNAIEATNLVKQNGLITISWAIEGNRFCLSITDEGTGLSNKDNLFVPFFTTKKQGSGIGLVLCRQIIEAHNGQLTLSNRKDGQGCHALIQIDVREPRPKRIMNG
jgi:nitrogen fixation/metabolism regulation signal transduction histidine kinase